MGKGIVSFTFALNLKIWDHVLILCTCAVDNTTWVQRSTKLCRALVEAGLSEKRALSVEEVILCMCPGSDSLF